MYGTPTTASTLYCTSPARVSNPIACTIYVSNGGGSTTALASDYTVSATSSVTARSTSNGGFAYTFQSTPTTITTTAFTIEVQLGGSDITGGLLSFPVYGTPTTASTLVCTSPARVNIATNCVITVSGASGATTALASDYYIYTTTGVATPTTNDGGFTHTFQTTPTSVTTTTLFTIGAEIRTSGSYIAGGLLTFPVYGTPTTASTLYCSFTSPLQLNNVFACTITVNGVSGPTTGAAVDFNATTSVGSPSLSTSNGGFTYTFVVTASVATGSFFVLVQTQGATISGGSRTGIVYGTPTAASSLTCATPTRIGVGLKCTIAVSNAAGATVAPATGFAALSTLDATIVLATANGGSAYTFTTSPPQSISALFSVFAMYNGSPLVGSSALVGLTVYGMPTTASALACLASSLQRVGTPINCTITVLGALGPTIGAISDFNISSTAGTALAPQLVMGGVSLTFSVTPLVAMPSFAITVTIGGNVISNGQLSYRVLGSPTTASTLTCTSSSTPPREGTPFLCTIIVKDNSGVSTGVSTDFSAKTMAVTGTTTNYSLTPTNDSAAFTFQPQPSVADPAYTISVFLGASTTLITSAPLVFVVYGNPAPQSGLSCVAPSPLRVGKNVNCTITVSDAAGTSTGIPTDFTVSSSSTASIMPTSINGGAQMTFTASPAAVSTAFGISVSIGGVTIGGGTPTFLAYGNPTTASTLSCVYTSRQRINAPISCTIYTSGSAGATTGLATDFIVNSTSSAAITPTASDGGATFTFSATPTASSTAFTVSVYQSGALISNSSQSIVVYGFPTTVSIMTCAGSTSPLRAGDAINCAIAVKGAAGFTTGLATDFVAAAKNAKTLPLSTPDGGSTFTFTAVPLLNYTTFSINASVGGSLILSGIQNFLVFGNPTTASTLTCAAPSPLRVQSTITCTIHCSARGPTTGLPSDFIATTSSELTSELDTADSGSTYTFTTTPENTTTAFVIFANSSTGQLLTKGLQSYEVYGFPDNTSELTCAGSQARAKGAPVVCTIVVMQNGEPTLGVPADFVPSASTAISAVTSVLSGSVMTFSVSAPASYVDVFVVTVVVGGSILTAKYRVFAAYNGPPSTTRTLAQCTPLNPRAGTTLDCIVSFLSGTGATSVIESDISIAPFASNSSLRRRRGTGDLGVQGLSSANGGDTYTFLVPLPATPVLQFTIPVDVLGVTTTSFTTEVYGVPTTASSLACHGLVSKAGFVAIDETVHCTITVNDNSGASTGLASDFIVHANNVLEHAVLVTQDGGHTFQFQLTSPNSSAPEFVVSVGLSSSAHRVSGSPESLTLICSHSVVCCDFSRGCSRVRRAVRLKLHQSQHVQHVQRGLLGC